MSKHLVWIVVIMVPNQWNGLAVTFLERIMSDDATIGTTDVILRRPPSEIVHVTSNHSFSPF
jgi:hypothetical protein